MNKTIGILAHVDAGKTTFAENILYHTKTIRQKGRVDHKDAFLDYHDIEKERGITIFSDQALIQYNDSNYYLVDTPGHVDFSPEMERAIQVMDYAIIIVSAVEGIEGHTETIWNLLRKYHVPTVFFINKTDCVGANVSDVMEDIRLNLTKDIFDITSSFNSTELSEDLIEFVAERDEVLLNKYLEGEYSVKLWTETMKHLIKNEILFICASGSALLDQGVISFFDKFDQLTTTTYLNDEEFGGRVFKIRHDENGARLTFIKALSGKLRTKDEISYQFEDEVICGKVNELRNYQGNKYTIINEASAGEIFAVKGLLNASVGNGIGKINDKVFPNTIPTLKSSVVYEDNVNIKDILKCFRILEVEDPSLNVVYVERLKEIDIHVMGLIQLEVLEKIINTRFGYLVKFATPRILYKETIDGQVIGYGHFEPLRHYAEVHLKVEAGERDSGIVVASSCHPDDLPIGQQNIICDHLLERDHHGLLTGSPLTDVKITLLTGRAHNKHTSGGDFLEATYRALRQGLEKANNKLLEPVYDFKIKIHLDFMGRVLSDIQNAHGTFTLPVIKGNKVIITGIAPVKTFMNYSVELASITSGKGLINLSFGGYLECHNRDEVIEEIAYNKFSDLDYPSSSVFCSKGKSFIVTWDRAEEFMHCKK